MESLVGNNQFSLINYINSHTSGNRTVETIEYIFSNETNPMYFNHKRRLREEKATGDPFHTGLPAFAQQDPDAVWNKTMYKFTSLLTSNFSEGVKYVSSFRESVRQYLNTRENFTHEEIDWLETFEDLTGEFDLDLAELVLEDWFFGLGQQEIDWITVKGGMTRLTEGLESILMGPIKYNRRVEAIQQFPGNDELHVSTTSGEPHNYDHVINTVPLGAMQAMDMSSVNLGYAKDKAIRELHYDDSMKIGIKFRTRWWQEEGPDKAMKGGQSLCDLPIRKVVYPSYGVDERDAPGILIASYVCQIFHHTFQALLLLCCARFTSVSNLAKDYQPDDS